MPGETDSHQNSHRIVGGGMVSSGARLPEFTFLLQHVKVEGA